MLALVIKEKGKTYIMNKMYMYVLGVSEHRENYKQYIMSYWQRLFQREWRWR